MANKNEGRGEDSDVDPEAQMQNYKGIYFGDTTEKYIDPVTGCHFRYLDLCQRMLKLKKQRKIIDKRLGLITSSQERSPNPVKGSKRHKASNGENQVSQLAQKGTTESKPLHSDERVDQAKRSGTEVAAQEEDKNMVQVKVKSQRKVQKQNEMSSSMQTLQPALQQANGKGENSRNYANSMVPENSLEYIKPQQSTGGAADSNSGEKAGPSNANDAFFAKRRNMRSSMSYLATQLQEQEERSQSQVSAANPKASVRQRPRGSVAIGQQQPQQIQQQQQQKPQVTKISVHKPFVMTLGGNSNVDAITLNTNNVNTQQSRVSSLESGTNAMAKSQISKATNSMQNSRSKNEAQLAYMSAESPEGRQSNDKNKEDQIRAHLQKLAKKQKKKVLDFTKTLEIRTQAPPVQGSGGQIDDIRRKLQNNLQGKLPEDSNQPRSRKPVHRAYSPIDPNQGQNGADFGYIQKPKGSSQHHRSQADASPGQAKFSKKNTALSVKRNKLAAIFHQQIATMASHDAEALQQKAQLIHSQQTQHHSSQGSIIEVQAAKAKAQLHNMYRRTRNSNNNTQHSQLLPTNHTQQHYQNQESLIYRTSEDMKNFHVSNSAEKVNYRNVKANHGSQQILAIESNALNKTMQDGGNIVRQGGKSLGGQRGLSVQSDLMLPYANMQQMGRESSNEGFQGVKIQMMKRPESKRFSVIQVNQHPDASAKPTTKKLIQRRAKILVQPEPK